MLSMREFLARACCPSVCLVPRISAATENLGGVLFVRERLYLLTKCSLDSSDQSMILGVNMSGSDPGDLEAVGWLLVTETVDELGPVGVEIGGDDSGRETGKEVVGFETTVLESEAARGAPGVTKGTVGTSGELLLFSGVSGTYPLQ